jgi:hypothetical protein
MTFRIFVWLTINLLNHSKMKRLPFIIVLLVFVAYNHVQAQVVSGIQAPQDGKMGKYSAWKKVPVLFDDNSTAVIEYRTALVKSKGISCHYNLEVKNLSDVKFKIRMKSDYFNQSENSHAGDETKTKIKPGETVVGRFVGQGCKKEKGEDKDAYERCISCDLTMSIFASK